MSEDLTLTLNEEQRNYIDRRAFDDMKAMRRFLRSFRKEYAVECPGELGEDVSETMFMMRQMPMILQVLGHVIHEFERDMEMLTDGAYPAKTASEVEKFMHEQGKRAAKFMGMVQHFRPNPDSSYRGPEPSDN